MKSAQSKSTTVTPLSRCKLNRSLESLFVAPDQEKLRQKVTLRQTVTRSLSNVRHFPGTPLLSPLSYFAYDLTIPLRRMWKSETFLNIQMEDSSGTSEGGNGHQYGKEKTEDILAKALKIALDKQKVYRQTDSERNSESGVEDFSEYSPREGSPGNSMMMSTPPAGIQTDSDGLILPKKILNPCMESSDRKNLHKELIFNNKIGKSVLNQKSELQRVLEKKRERQIFLQQQQEPVKIESGIKGELNRVIMERAQKLKKQNISKSQEQEIEEHVNPEYLNARAKLRGRMQTQQ